MIGRSLNLPCSLFECRISVLPNLQVDSFLLPSTAYRMLLKYKKGNSGGNWNWSKEHTGMPPGSARRCWKPSGPKSQLQTESAIGSRRAWPALCCEDTLSV